MAIVEFYKNKITLYEIMKSIYSGTNTDFLNILFHPLKENNRKTFLDSYIGKNNTTFMHGNFNNEKRDKLRVLNKLAFKICENDVFAQILTIVEKMTEDIRLDRHHKVFELIKLDADNMPDSFRECIDKCFDEKHFSTVLLLMILWSIYGEHIYLLAELYENIPQISESSFVSCDGEVHLLSKSVHCRDIFIGRGELLLKMNECFQSGGHFLFLQGMGGIGKSECAKQYAEKYKSQYDTIVFAEYTDSFISTVNNNNNFSLSKPFLSEHHLESDVQFYHRKLNQLKKLTDKILVILDNIDEFSKELDDFFKLPFDIIVTTRYDYFSEYPKHTIYVNEIQDRVLLREIFYAYYGKNVDNDPFVDMLIDMFQGHTMAVELVAKQAKASELTPKEILNILNDNAEIELQETFRVLNYDSEQCNIIKHMQKLFNIASLSDKEKYIMSCLSVLPLTGIKKRDFKNACGLGNYSVINRLIQNSWINESDGIISLHTLIKETINITLKPDLIKCTAFLNGMVRDFSESWCYYAKRKEKDLIAQIVAHIYNRFPEPVPELYDFFEWMLIILTHCSEHSLTMKIIRNLAAVYVKEFDENHFRTAKITCMVGYVNKNCSFIDESIYCFERGRNIIKNLESKSVEQMVYLSNIDVTLTNIYTEYYDLSDNKELTEKIIELCNEIIEIRTSLRDKSNPYYLSLTVPYRNLAWVEAICHQDYNKAYNYMKKATSEHKQSGSQFESFLIDYLQSRIAQKQGNLQSSIDYMCSAIKKYTEYFGKERVIKTIQLIIELGDLYVKAGDNDCAVKCYRKATEYMQGSSSCMRLYDKVIEKLKSIENN